MAKKPRSYFFEKKVKKDGPVTYRPVRGGRKCRTCARESARRKAAVA